MNEQLNSSPAVITHDFGAFLQFVAEEKVVLTPKQSMIPLPSIKKVMERFQIKELHEDIVGGVTYKKRGELEYPRFYFLDLLAIGGGFLKITNRNLLSKGSQWQAFFDIQPDQRGFRLFCAVRDGFNIENWLLRGGDYGKQLEEKSKVIWSQMLRWSDGKLIDWSSWAREVIRVCGLRWNSIDQTHAESLAIWGLGYCFLKPLEYFGLIVGAEKEGDDFSRLKTFRLSEIGCDYFNKLFSKADPSRNDISPFSLN